MSIDQRSWGFWRSTLIGWAGAIAVIVAPIVMFGPVTGADVGTVRILIPTAAAAVAIAWSYWMATRAFRHIDEFHREAGRFAWYWGGSAGLALSAVGYVFIGQGGLHWLDPVHFHLGRDLFRAFQWGYLLGIGTPMAGFLVARLFWKVTRR